jgi:hypothetical protein
MYYSTYFSNEFLLVDDVLLRFKKESEVIGEQVMSLKATRPNFSRFPIWYRIRLNEFWLQVFVLLFWSTDRRKSFAPTKDRVVLTSSTVMRRSVLVGEKSKREALSQLARVTFNNYNAFAFLK